MSSIHLPIRQLVEFLLRTGSIDSRFTGFDRALEGARIHRKLQKAAGEDYQAEVFLSAERLPATDSVSAAADDSVQMPEILFHVHLYFSSPESEPM